MPEVMNILVVDDDPDSRTQLASILTTLGFAVTEAASGEEALARMEGDDAPDLLIADVVMPGLSGLEVLKRYRARGGRAPVLILSALDKVDTVVTAMRLGATDYLTKPFDGDELREILDRVLGEGARPRVIPAAKLTATALGESAAMRRVSELIDCIADADVPVLITGESGVGKDVVAREIHARSGRHDRVFVKINCAALPGELLESELFGHERGSFTGAARTKPGQFELADGGTLFLDEIGEMPVSLQAKLLQALQDNEFYRVGGQRKIRVDARVIVATNRDLESAMEEGSFREDLYYRLNVVHLHMPPLRERREDIPSLLEHFVAKYGKRYGRSAADVPPAVVARFLSYDWPGNIRELENLVRRLMVLRDPRYVLSELKEKPAVAGPAPSVAGLAAAATGSTAAASDEGENFRIDLKLIGRQAANAAEREAIVTMLGHTGGNKREAAQRLGISYKAILYKIREFGIGRPRPARRPTPVPTSTPTSASTLTTSPSPVVVPIDDVAAAIDDTAISPAPELLGASLTATT